MKILFVVLSVILSRFMTSEACHGKPTPVTKGGDNENGDVRSKRSLTPPADARKNLSDFFTECMARKSKPNILPKMQAVVEFVLRDSRWYKILDESLCSDKKDTRECWNNEADGLIDWNSEMVGPLRECFLEYSTGVRTGGYRQKRQSNSWSNFEERSTKRPEPPCPQVTDSTYGSCMEESVNRTTAFPSLRNFHWESIAIFLREHYTRCRYKQIKEPWTNGKLVYRKTCPPYRYKTTSGSAARYASQQCVPFILQEIIKEESPLRISSAKCNKRFANVTFNLKLVTPVETTVLTPAENEFARYGHRGKHNGADIIGYCDPKSVFTVWFDNVTTDGSGDDETLREIRRRHPENFICPNPSGIQIRVAQTDEPWYTSGNNLKTMSPRQGLQCVNSMQHHKPCANFKVRFCCLVNPKPTDTKPAHPYRKTISTVGTCGPNDKWGYWKNIDSKSGNGGDFEEFKKYGMPKCEPVAVEGRVRGSKRPYTRAHNNLSIEDPKLGIVCKEEMQPRERPCRDFEVRFCCKDGRGIVKAPTARPRRPTTRPQLIVNREIVVRA